MKVEGCSCGTARRRFWLWRDTNGVLHASAFAPSNGTVGSVIAATARDALIPLTNGNTPKHVVQDADDPTVTWPGRCSAVAVG